MERTASGSGTFPASAFEGWNIGAVSVKRVRLHEDGYVSLADGPQFVSDILTDFYASIGSDGDCITTSQLRQLETVAVQCRRRREAPDERLLA